MKQEEEGRENDSSTRLEERGPKLEWRSLSSPGRSWLFMNYWNTNSRILAKLVATQSVQQGGTAIPTISWAEGVAFLISPFPDESEVIIEEKLKGIIHYNTVLFALKPGFEAEIFMRGSQIRINLIDVGY